MNEMIAFCGVDCAQCTDYLSSKCPGCRESIGEGENMCNAVRCCISREIDCCGQCGNFPCDDMMAFFEETLSHKEAGIRMRQVHENQKR